MSSRSQSFTSTILGVPPAGTLKECTPNLMPFHIDYTGTAPMSTFFKVEDAKKNVGVPEKDIQDREWSAKPDVSEEATKTIEEMVTVEVKEINTSGSASGGDVEMQDVLEETQPTEDTLVAQHASSSSTAILSETTLDSTPTMSTIASSSSTLTVIEASSSNTLVPSSSSTSSIDNPGLPSSVPLKPRFKSTFRGRTIQGLSVDIPAGYTGVILRSSDDHSLKAAQATAKMSASVQAKKKAAAVGKGKGKVKTKQVEVEVEETETGEEMETEPGKGKGTIRRSTQSTRSSVVDIDVVEEVEDNYDDIADEGSWSAGLGDGKTKTMLPTSVFSSFILWHPDIPVDEGRDEYFGALNEWVGIAEAIHRIPVD